MKNTQSISALNVISRLQNFAASQNEREESIKEIGFRFYRWAITHFHQNSKKLNRFLVREELFEDFNYCNPEIKLSLDAWREKFAKFCELQGYFLNPEPLRNCGQYITKKAEARLYDNRSNRWAKNPDRETMIKEVYFVSTFSMSNDIGSVLKTDVEKVLYFNIDASDSESLTRREIYTWRLALAITICSVFAFITLITYLFLKHGKYI